MTFAASLMSAVAVAGLGVLLVRSERRHAVVPKPTNRKSVVQGLDVTSVQFWTTVAGAAAITYLVIFAITGLVVISAIPALVVGTLPKTYFVRKRSQRPIL